MNAETTIYKLFAAQFPDTGISLYEIPTQVGNAMPQNWIQIVPEGGADSDHYAPIYNNEWRVVVHARGWSEARALSAGIHTFLTGLERTEIDDVLVFSASASGAENVERDAIHDWPVIERTYTIIMSAPAA